MNRFANAGILLLSLSLTFSLFAFSKPALGAEGAPIGPLDWPQWRGPHGTGVAAADQDPPLKWSGSENILWRADVPGRGHSSPTLLGDRVFLASADESQELQWVLCYDRTTGKKLWQTAVH